MPTSRRSCHRVDRGIRAIVVSMVGIPQVAPNRVKRRRLIVALALAWVIAGGAVMWPWTSSCFGTFREFGIGTAIGSCMPLTGLVLVMWSMAGAVIGLVLYNWRRSRGTSQ